MSVDVSTIRPSSFMWSCHSISKIKQMQWSWMILLLPIRVFQHPQYTCIYTSNINQDEEQFQTPARCWSHTSVFPQKLVQNVKPTLNGIIVNDDCRFVIFFFTHSCVIMTLWWKEPCFLLVHMIPVSGHWYNHIQKNKPLFFFQWAIVLELQSHSSLACQSLSYS